MNEQDRFVKVYPKIQKNKMFKKPRALQLFLFLILNAKVKNTFYQESGTLIIKQEEIAEELECSDRTVREFLKFLKDEEVIDYCQKGNSTYIKIINFEKYNPYKG